MLIVVAELKVDLTFERSAGMMPGSGWSAKGFGNVVRHAVEDGWLALAAGGDETVVST